MKKLLFGLIATVMLTNLTFGQSTIKFSDYGFYHNEVLTEFTKKYGENQKDIDFVIDESIVLMKIKYPELFNDIDGLTIKKMFAVKNANDFDYKKIWNSNKEALYSNKVITKKIGDLINAIIEKNYSYEQAISAMDDFKRSNKLTSDESNCLTAIRSVLVSSNQYWNSTAGKQRAGSATLIADFAGLAMFGWGGPVAVVASFGMSYLTHQNDN